VALDFPSLIERISRTHQYEACLLSFVNTDLDPNGQMNVFLSSARQHAWNPAQASPATPWEQRMDLLMTSQAAAADDHKRKVFFDEVQQIVWDQAPLLYLLHKNVLVGVSNQVQHLQPSVLRPQLFWNAELLSMRSNEQRAGK
jgi:peptide/nickel transport system substrate-binding protein